MNTITIGHYVKSVQSKSIFYQIKGITADTVILKRVNGKLNTEYEVSKATFNKSFYPAV